MEDSKTEKKAGGGKGMMIVLMLVVAGAAGGGGWYFSQSRAGGGAAHGAAPEAGHGEPGPGGGATPAKAHYVALDPAFVVNLADDVEGRYLQVEVQLMSRDEKAVDTLAHYAPMLRNHLLMLFSQQKAEQLRTREEKERLQALALEEVRKALSQETGRPVVEALYFTSFVMQ